MYNVLLLTLKQESPQAATTPGNDGGLRDNNLYVKHFDADMDDDMLHDLFKVRKWIEQHEGSSEHVRWQTVSTAVPDLAGVVQKQIGRSFGELVGNLACMKGW